jgi:hypothetical protein
MARADGKIARIQSMIENQRFWQNEAKFLYDNKLLEDADFESIVEFGPGSFRGDYRSGHAASTSRQCA